MDPISQGLIGASAAQSKADKANARWATLFGLLAGMAADLDVLIDSEADPLLGLEYHRHFTHSLAFIPLGALLCAVFFYFIFKSRSQLKFKSVYLFCLLGYATHALLDSCTSYGTQLFWPFSDYRVSWNTISIIDPLFTLPLLICVLWGCIAKRPLFGFIGLIYVIGYLIIGVVQNQRAEQFAIELIEHRGHTADNLNIKPTFANIVVWKSTYEFEGRYYSDGIRAGLAPSFYVGESVPTLNVARDFPWLEQGSVQYNDIERFRHFAQGYLAIDHRNSNVIADIRYSLMPDQISALWGITLDPKTQTTEHVDYGDLEHQGLDRKELSKRLWRMITNREPSYSIN